MMMGLAVEHGMLECIATFMHSSFKSSSGHSMSQDGFRVLFMGLGLNLNLGTCRPLKLVCCQACLLSM